MTKGAMIAIRIMALSLSSFLLALMLSVLLRRRNGEPIPARRSTGSSRRSSVHRRRAEPSFYHQPQRSLAAARNNVPTVCGLSEAVRDGGLLSYGTDQVDTWRRAATYVDRILRGEKPADLPIQLPTKFEMVVNLKTAK